MCLASPQCQMCWALYHIYAMSLDCSLYPMFLLYWEVKKWTQHFKCVLPVLGRGKVSSVSFFGSAVPHRAQEALLCHMSTLLAKRLKSPAGPQFLLCQAAFQLVSSQCVLLSGVFLLRSWTLGFPFLNFMKFLVAHFSSIVWVSLSGSTDVWYISHSFQFSTACNLVEVALYLFLWIMKVLNSAGPSLSVGASDWFLGGLCATGHSTLGSPVLPVFSLSHCIYEVCS